MRRNLVIWLAPLLVVLSSWGSPVFGQMPIPGAENDRNPPVLQYTVAVLAVIVVMVVLCMPTRKSQATKSSRE